MRHTAPTADDLTSEQILFLRSMRWLPSDMPVNLRDLADIALGFRFPLAERHAARVELARAYAKVTELAPDGLDPLGDLLVELAQWAESRRFDDDQDPATDTPDERVVRAYQRWAAMRRLDPEPQRG